MLSINLIREQILHEIQEFFKNKDYYLILDKQSVLYSKSGEDLTANFLEMYRKK